MKKFFFNLTKGILIALLWSISVFMFSQNATVNGKVTDITGENLIGVTVQIQETSIGTVTDMNRGFVLSSVPNNAIFFTMC